MTAHRVAGAPRLIEWTGERCVPWADDAAVVYEHFHRYLFASQLVSGKDVLDLASGEGFGAALLAESARSVLGMDIDSLAVEHSKLNHVAPNLEFREGDARDLRSFEAGSFGAVVAFEMIEHLAEHDQVLDGIAHVLAGDGILIISSPDRTAYSENSGFENPYHVRELTLEELCSLLQRRFAHIATWAQRTVTGSALLELGDRDGPVGGFQRFVMERHDGEWQLASGISPMYVVAVASNAPLPQAPDDSVLVDPGQELVGTWQRAQAEAHSAALEMQRKYDAIRRELLDTGDALADERRLTAALQERAAGDEQVIARLQSEFAAYRSAIEASYTWKLYQWLRRMVYRVLGGRNSPAGELVARTVRRLGKLATRQR